MKHCWHDTGISKLVNPPQFEDICCHCGKKRWRVETKNGHGKFFPKRNILNKQVEEKGRPFQEEECVLETSEVQNAV